MAMLEMGGKFFLAQTAMHWRHTCNVSTCFREATGRNEEWASRQEDFHQSDQHLQRLQRALNSGGNRSAGERDQVRRSADLRKTGRYFTMRRVGSWNTQSPLWKHAESDCTAASRATPWSGSQAEQHRRSTAEAQRRRGAKARRRSTAEAQRRRGAKARRRRGAEAQRRRGAEAQRRAGAEAQRRKGAESQKRRGVALAQGCRGARRKGAGV